MVSVRLSAHRYSPAAFFIASISLVSSASISRGVRGRARVVSAAWPLVSAVGVALERGPPLAEDAPGGWDTGSPLAGCAPEG
jgi:hypothetical protein